MKRILPVIISGLMLTMILSCSADEQEITINVITTTLGFDIFYIINGNITYESVGTLKGAAYYFTKSEKNVDNIRIYVTGKTVGTTTTDTKEIIILVNGEVVKEATNTGVDTLILNYTWGEENSDTTETSSE